MGEPDASIARAADFLRGARRIAVFTGAGISAESGVPTFRGGDEGLWSRYDPMQLATPEAYARDPAMVSEWYDWRRQLILKARPNPGHEALAALEDWCEGTGRSFDLITQNIDRLHQRGGSRRVIELHGCLLEWRGWRSGTVVPVADDPFESYPPTAADGEPLRPGIVWFGEMLPIDELVAAEEASATCDAMLVVGTSGAVYPAAGCIDLAWGAGASVIEVNPEETEASHKATILVRAPAARALPAIVAAVRG